jgi:hypothetical protein
MATKHILSLEVLNVSNPEILSIKDTSQYASELPVTCGDLAITSPGFNSPSTIDVQPGFDFSVNACALNLQTTDCSGLRTVIPDGVYIIRYSVSPGDKVYVEYNHLRTTSLMELYYRKLCKLDIDKCTPYSEREKVLEEMHDIRTMIDAAKAKVEYCSSPQAGTELLNFAKRKLEKITCTVC